MANPYRITNFEALRTTNPVLYQRMASNSFFTSATAPANRLLRPFSQFNTGNGLVYQNLPLGENKGRSIQILVNRRYANGFTANMALSFTRTRSNRTVNEFDREPTLWLDDNNSRPYRLSGGAVYELPFGANRRWMSDGGVFAALAGGWQLAGTFERQPGSLIQFTTNSNGAPNGNVLHGRFQQHQEGQTGNCAGRERQHRSEQALVQHPGLRTKSRELADHVQHARVSVSDRRLEGPGVDVREPQHPA